LPAACLSAAQAVASPNTSSVGVSDNGTDDLGACNIYVQPSAVGAAFDMAQGEALHDPDYYFGCQGSADSSAAHRVDCRWPPQNRKTLISPRVLPAGSDESDRLRPDYAGLYIRVTHRYLTGIGGSSRVITDSSVNFLEPSTFGVG
jgi:hypothetical protein